MSKDREMDEIWRDFYATMPSRPTKPVKSINPTKTSERLQKSLERKELIHFVWMYNSIASTGTKTPVYDLAAHLNVSAEEVGELVERALDLRLLCAPKRGSFRCELSAIAVRMISNMKIGLQ